MLVVPLISIAVSQDGRYLREISHKTQPVTSSIAEVCSSILALIFSVEDKTWMKKLFEVETL